ncbi:MAG: tail fiber domain-containing protein [Putridiphycobacter sp.]
MKNIIISICILILGQGFIWAQNFPEGIAYQAQVRGTTGAILDNQIIGLTFNIRQNSINGVIAWQETHLVTTNNIGHFEVNIGQGTSTGNGIYTQFEDINWGDSNYFIEMLLDENNSGNFVSIYTQQFMAVPYAYHSKTTDQKYKLSELLDVDTTGINIGDVLAWDGSKWVPQVDTFTFSIDTVQYAQFSDSSNYAQTAGYALNCQTPTFVDSSYFAYYADSALYATQSNQSIYSDSANFSDTSQVALYALGNWSLTGDTIGTNPYFLGTLDSTDLKFKTNNIERMVIKANGKIGLGTTTPLTDFHVNDKDGVLFTGTFGLGNIPTQGAGTRMMWYPAKSAFRVGTVTGTTWDDAFVGDYSFAGGYNTKASGNYSVAFGFASTALNEGAFAAGNLANASGLYSFAAGHNPTASGDYSISLGRAGLASGFSSVALGYHPTASGDYAMSLGNYSTASGNNSFAMGFQAKAIHSGSFIYADKSTTGYIETTADNQFMVRAAGGTIFFTSSDLTTGVVLAPGAGSWSILSDSTKKENITPINYNDYLSQLDSIDVYRWNYKSQANSIQHIGPMAQDFYAAFNIGSDSTYINSGDFDGVNLVLLKGLNEKIEVIDNQKDELNKLNQELELLKKQRQELEEKLKFIEEKINQQH